MAKLDVVVITLTILLQVMPNDFTGQKGNVSLTRKFDIDTNAEIDTSICE